jgi:anti-anti-sigma factor
LKTLNPQDDVLVIQHQGEFVIVSVNPLVEGLDHTLGDTLAEIVLGAVRTQEHPLAIVDLTGVELFGSMFLSVLLRCWKACVTRGGMMVLCGVGERVRELLKIVRLDVLWPIYDSSDAAMRALSSN